MDKSYTLIPKSVLKSKHLTTTAKLIYAGLADYAYNGLYCYPSQKRLGEDLHVSERWVRETLRDLAKYGLIRICRTKKDGFKDQNLYILTPLNEVHNLDREEPEFIDEGDYVVSEEYFEGMVQRSVDFFSRGVDKPDRYKTAKKRIADKDWDKMSNTDWCVYFADVYESVYKENYRIVWSTDHKIINDLFSKFAIKSGDHKKSIIDYFIKCYDTTFKGDGYEKPKMSSLRVEWIQTKLVGLWFEELTHVAYEEEATEVGEVVGEFFV